MCIHIHFWPTLHKYHVGGAKNHQNVRTYVHTCLVHMCTRAWLCLVGKMLRQCRVGSANIKGSTHKRARVFGCAR